MFGIREVFLERSRRKIWVKPEQGAEPYIPVIRGWGAIATKAQRGLEFLEQKFKEVENGAKLNIFSVC